ncbi:glycosyltransferase [Lacticaseibacillus baoqingensis]|uniref:Glycosyltransferase n=1 Tax=Lacticaseibacillus baoqingensis TaxID=2486013 RepID=A0ABW4E590_9LACO|nr:glycosyltransferase [Lacticaseibacillus baoqingensis]
MTSSTALKICVLLSTYNGEHYLAEQVHSILTQTGRGTAFTVQIYIRDDGSSDNTLKIIQQLTNDHPDTVFLLTDDLGNAGVRASFLQLVKHAPNDAALYFLADQDDVWEPNKVQVFLEYYAQTTQALPIGLYSDLWVADQNAQVTGQKMSQVAHWQQLTIDYEFLSFNYRITGAAFAFNARAKELLALISIAEINASNMHDSFFALTIAACGQLIGIADPLVRYRQHAHNVVGAAGHHKTWREHWQSAFAFPGQKIFNNVLLNEFLHRQHLRLRTAHETAVMADYLAYYHAAHCWQRWQAALMIKAHISQPHPWLNVAKLMVTNVTKPYQLPQN